MERSDSGAQVLSRIAESLYWVGRYAERAEQTARILDVHVHHLLEDPAVEEDAACRTLLSVMGTARPALDQRCTVNTVIHLLANDPSNSSSIVGSLTAAREGARGAREAISSEMWECLNATWNALPGQVSTGSYGSHQLFTWVKGRTAMLAGLADSTMSHDDGWRFLTLGRQLERIDMTARLLSARFADSSTSPEWVTTLRCCSAHEAYLRTYRRAVDASLVAEFLLLDRLFPRSVFAALLEAERVLADLDPQQGRAGLDDEARRILGRARTDLEFRRVDELLTDLPSHLRALQHACAAANDAVGRRYFRQAAVVGWSA
jgi:uncharacterized alpha-E superfamily protein